MASSNWSSKRVVQDFLWVPPTNLAKDSLGSTARRLTLEEVVGAAHQFSGKFHAFWALTREKSWNP